MSEVIFHAVCDEGYLHKGVFQKFTPAEIASDEELNAVIVLADAKIKYGCPGCQLNCSVRRLSKSTVEDLRSLLTTQPQLT